MLGAYLTSYFRAKNTKESTEVFYRQTWTNLEDYFGRSAPLESITPAMAKDSKHWLETNPNRRDKANQKPLSSNTVRRRLGFCRQIFAQAFQDGEIVRNPFAGRDLPTAVRSNRDRQFYVPLDVFQKVLESVPNARWRALLVLARIGALRVPSEVKKLKWEHVAWDAKRISIVLSSKTEHHAKRQVRIVP